VWQVPQGCPVWRAKLGKACAGEAKPIARKPAKTTTTAAAANSLPFPEGRVTPRIACNPVVRDIPVPMHED